MSESRARKYCFKFAVFEIGLLCMSVVIWFLIITEYV